MAERCDVGIRPTSDCAVGRLPPMLLGAKFHAKGPCGVRRRRSGLGAFHGLTQRVGMLYIDADGTARIGSFVPLACPGLYGVGRRVAAADIVYVEKASSRRAAERYGIAPKPMARSVHLNERGELSDGASAGSSALLGAGCAALAAVGLRRRRGVSLRVQTSRGPTSPSEARRGTHGIATATRRQRASTTGGTAEH